MKVCILILLAFLGAAYGKACAPDEFQCECHLGGCVPDFNVCDGTEDCFDGSDETEEACACKDGEFTCTPIEGTKRPQCIPLKWVCDDLGRWDCPYGDDETNCPENDGIHNL